MIVLQFIEIWNYYIYRFTQYF